MDEAQAAKFAADWAASWNVVDIDAIVSHLAADATMRSPLALRIVGQQQVAGRDNIRRYWSEAYGHITRPNLTLEGHSWDARRRRLVVWWQAELPAGPTRACEYMDFNERDQVVRSEAYYGAA